MLKQMIDFFLLYQTITSSSLSNTQIVPSEYATIEGDVEYLSPNADAVLGDVSGISSVVRCANQCKFNGLCRTATYYEDLAACSLFAAVLYQGTKSARLNAKIITLVNRGLPSNWYFAGNMTTARDFHKSTFIMTTSSVLIIGGSDGNNNLASTETVFPLNGTFRPQGSTTATRRFHTADRLNDHLVVVAGGWFAILTAELYDALAGVSNATINLSAPRAEHTSAVIINSDNSTTKLLLVGGMDGNGALSTGDVFQIATNSFMPTSNNMTSARCYHTATSLPNGYVLLAGGTNNASKQLDSLELYNSSSNSFVTIVPRMSMGRASHTATYIPSLQAVLFVGGQNQQVALQTYDLFNVSTLTFIISNGSMLLPRAYQTATLLLDEQVLIVGGQNTDRLSSCELYNPFTGRFTFVANISTERADHTSTLLLNTGQVLTCGGQNSVGSVLNSCELYHP